MKLCFKKNLYLTLKKFMIFTYKNLCIRKYCKVYRHYLVYNGSPHDMSKPSIYIHLRANIFSYQLSKFIVEINQMEPFNVD